MHSCGHLCGHLCRHLRMLTCFTADSSSLLLACLLLSLSTLASKVSVTNSVDHTMTPSPELMVLRPCRELAGALADPAIYQATAWTSSGGSCCKESCRSWCSTLLVPDTGGVVMVHFTLPLYILSVENDTPGPWPAVLEALVSSEQPEKSRL